MSDLRQFVKALKDAGFDGLFNRARECACSRLDLMPCGSPVDCEPGKVQPAADGEGDYWVGEGDPLPRLEGETLSALIDRASRETARIRNGEGD